MNQKVSIVVPVFNSEDYIDRCIESLINQSYRDIQIVIVNDGSTDKSKEIIERYAKKDNRIEIINNRNMGVSYSRNIGIKASIGKYIMFVDSDDWIDQDMVLNLYDQAEKEKLDLIMCSYVREFADHSKKKIFNINGTILYEDLEIKNQLLRKLIGPVKEELSQPQMLDSIGTVWGKLYKTELIKNNNINFVDLKKIGSAEDVLFNIYLFNCIKKAMFTNKSMYHYWRENTKSITSKYNLNLKYQRYVFIQYIHIFIEENKFDQIFFEALNNRICISVLGLGLIECSKDNKANFIEKIKNIKHILNEEYVKSAYKNLELKYFPIHWRIFYFFNKNRMSICSYLMLCIIEFCRKKI